MQIYSVHDSKAEAFMQPFFAANEAVALRYVSTAVNTVDHEFRRHTEDYSLYHIGEFHETSGEIGSFDPRCVTLLIHLLDKETFDEGLPWAEKSREATRPRNNEATA